MSASTVIRRSDLVIRPQTARSGIRWAIKDPVALRYFHLSDQEYALFLMLDGSRSLSDMIRDFERRFAPSRLSLEQLNTFLTTLIRQDLAIVDRPGTSGEYVSRRKQRKRQQRIGLLANPLAIRFRGVDPDRLLNRLKLVNRVLFSPLFAVMSFCLMTAAVAIVVTRFDEVVARIPTLQQYLALENLVWLPLVLAAIKVLHELSHALTCKYFGGECHDIGIMLLVFVPCLYCNVSDSWMFDRKRERIAVSAAGIICELWLASVATILWWFSEPGLFQNLCLNVMVLCSISSLLINGNPLLRYDGYFILSDLWDRPNLRTDASRSLQQAFQRWFLGVSAERRRTLDSTTAGVLFYAVLSIAYRWLVVLGILWLLLQVTQQYEVALLGQLLATIVLAGTIVPPIVQATQWSSVAARAGRLHWGRTLLTLMVFAGLLIGIMLVPLPFHILASAVVQPAHAERVYVSAAGVLQSSLSPGESVEAGDRLAHLINPELDFAVAQLRGHVAEQRRAVESIELSRLSNPATARTLGEARSHLLELELLLQQKVRDQQQLTLLAPRNGVVIAPPQKVDRETAGELGTWRGTPLDPSSLGSFLEPGTLLGLVGEAESRQVLLRIEQEGVEFVEPGQHVRLRLPTAPGQEVSGILREISEVEQDEGLLLFESAIWPVAIRRSPTAMTTGKAYEARVELDASAPLLLIGTQGQARIRCAPQTLHRRLLRLIQQTFRFEL